MTGDLEREPVEGVDALDDLANSMMPERDADTPDEEGEEPDESEGDEPEEEEGEEEEEEEGKVFTIKVDGKEIQLTEAELIAKAQQGVDYTTKTMAVAEERKAVEAEREHIATARQQVDTELTETVNRLHAFSQFMEANIGQMPDASLLDYDTAGYLRQKEQYEARKGQLQEAYAAIQHVQDEQARQRQAWIAERAGATEKALANTLPGWSDDMLNDLSGYAKALGLTPQTVGDAMLSPGFWQLAHKAKAFDALQAKKAEMKPTQKLAKVARPAAVNTTGKVAERVKREAAFNQNPSVDTLAALLR